MGHLLDYSRSERRSCIARFASPASWLLLVLAIAYFAWRGPLSIAGDRLWDYAVCASSSQVWLAGGDPYDSGVVNTNWQRQDVKLRVENQIVWLRPIVPPTTLVVLAPFAAMRAEVGAYAYLVFTFGLLVIATWACGRWAGLTGGTAWRFYAAGVLLSVPATLGLYSGNPVMVAGPLILIGLYLSDRHQRDWTGGFLLGIGTACKIQLGVPMLIAWAFIGRTRPVVVAAITFGALAATGAIRMSVAHVDWWEGWTRNVREANGPGGLNDYETSYNPDDHLNLQIPLWTLTGDRTLTTATTLSIVGALGVLFLATMIRGKRSWTPATNVVALSVAASLTVLPVYHRTYDAIILLPAFAIALMALRSKDRKLKRIAWIVLLFMASLLVPAGLVRFAERNGYVPAWMLDLSLYQVAIVRYRPWMMLAVASALMVFLNRFPNPPKKIPDGTFAQP